MPLEDIILATVVKEVTERLLKNKRLKKRIRKALQKGKGRKPSTKRKRPAKQKRGHPAAHRAKTPRKGGGKPVTPVKRTGKHKKRTGKPSPGSNSACILA